MVKIKKLSITSKNFLMALCIHIHPATLHLHDHSLKLSTPGLSDHSSISLISLKISLHFQECYPSGIIIRLSFSLFICLASFTQLNYFEIDPCCSMYQFLKWHLHLSISSYRQMTICLPIHYLKNTTFIILTITIKFSMKFCIAILYGQSFISLE